MAAFGVSLWSAYYNTLRTRYEANLIFLPGYFEVTKGSNGIITIPNQEPQRITIANAGSRSVSIQRVTLVLDGAKTPIMSGGECSVDSSSFIVDPDENFTFVVKPGDIEVRGIKLRVRDGFSGVGEGLTNNSFKMYGCVEILHAETGRDLSFTAMNHVVWDLRQDEGVFFATPEPQRTT